MRPGLVGPSLLIPLRPAAALAVCVWALCWTAAAQAQSAPPGRDLQHTLRGILSYTRWPQPPDPVRLCFIGSSPHVDALQREDPVWPGPPQVRMLALQPSQPVAAHCDALYVGTLDAAQWPALAKAVDDQPVLTLCERSLPCLATGMVRLDFEASDQEVRFEVNMDAVARGRVRLHPQVLRLGARHHRSPSAR